ncbi:alpha-glucosidase C-terminal domain-containing protein [Paenibacillus profundus]|uniref:Alpha-glucosidase C-terminal domain-containing protein n=1 Tax=Paenibacillus profundus TaxID=1173085 RepID=A0ABS8YBL9_9BACL|nr:alpha-glucosidase C-terminal domain-containing protein [Paenibacillus profundus]MCE5169400.1 alpha-glucosidase C-terminal domain-containing protein [Paenibacillus profundus]
MRTGSFRFVHAKENDQVIAYERANADECWIFVLNGSESKRTVCLQICEGEWQSVSIDDKSDSGEMLAGNHKGLQVEVEGLGWRILKLEQ